MGRTASSFLFTEDGDHHDASGRSQHKGAAYRQRDLSRAQLELEPEHAANPSSISPQSCQKPSTHSHICITWEPSVAASHEVQVVAMSLI